MKIFLIGMPGSGKTTLGKALAKRLNTSFVDLDTEIERQEGIPVRMIFKEKGEDTFRELEHKILKSWCERADSFVLSTGGGTPCYRENMELINRAGKSVLLDVSFPELIRRIKATDLSERPLFSGKTDQELGDRVTRLLEARTPFYRQANLIITNDSITPEELEQKLKRESDGE